MLTVRTLREALSVSAKMVTGSWLIVMETSPVLVCTVLSASKTEDLYSRKAGVSMNALS